MKTEQTGIPERVTDEERVETNRLRDEAAEAMEELKIAQAKAQLATALRDRNARLLGKKYKITNGTIRADGVIVRNTDGGSGDGE